MNFRLGLALCAGNAIAQQYQGNSISGTLPTVGGAEVAFFKITDPSGLNNELTLVNYYSHGSDNNRIVESNIQRVVIVITGLQRDCNNYENDVSAKIMPFQTQSSICRTMTRQNTKSYDRKSLTCFGGSGYMYPI